MRRLAPFGFLDVTTTPEGLVLPGREVADTVDEAVSAPTSLRIQGSRRYVVALVPVSEIPQQSTQEGPQ